MREPSAAARPWSVSDINYQAIESERVRSDRDLFYRPAPCRCRIAAHRYGACRSATARSLSTARRRAPTTQRPHPG